MSPTSSQHPIVRLRNSSEFALQEVEMIKGTGILNASEEDLKHDMIDTSKAKSIVTALKFVKQKLVSSHLA